MGDFYTKSGAPSTSSSLTSATMRSEFALIEAAFDKLPALTGNGSKFLRINSGASAVEALSASDVRTAIGLAIGTNVQAWDADLDSIAALSKTDGNFIVGNGSAWVAESGATARTSLGVGTGDSPQFTGIELGNSSDTTITRASAGNIAVEGVTVATASNSITLTNKTITSPTLSGTIAGTPTASGDWTFKSDDEVVSGYQIVLESRFNAYGAGISFQSRTSSGGTLVEMARITADGEDAWDTTAANQDAGLRFFTCLDGSSTEKLRLNAAGNLILNDGAELRQILTNSQTVNPSSLSSGAVYTTSLTFTGVQVGDHLIFTIPSSWFTTDRVSIHATITATNQVSIYISNESAGVVDLPSDTVRFTCIRYG